MFDCSVQLCDITGSVSLTSNGRPTLGLDDIRNHFRPLELDLLHCFLGCPTENEGILEKISK